jgi:hypothetical protein
MNLDPLPCFDARSYRRTRRPPTALFRLPAYGSFGLYSVKSGSSSTAMASSTRATMA